MSFMSLAFLLLSVFLPAAVLESRREAASGACNGTSGDYMSLSFDMNLGFGVSYTNFDSFDQLNPPCDFQRLFIKDENGTHYFKIAETDHVICSPLRDCSSFVQEANQGYSLDSVFTVQFSPSRYVPLDDVNLSNLVNSSELNNFNLLFYRIDKFETKRKRPTIDINLGHETTVRIFFYASILEFYYDGKRLDRQTCIQAIRELGASNGTSYVSLFSQPNPALYEFSSDNAFTDEICPIVFHGARSYSLTFYSLKRTHLVLNTLSFMNVTEGLSAEDSQPLESILRSRLDSEIGFLQMNSVYNLALDGKLIDKYIFRSLQLLNYGGTLSSIELDLFKRFVYLKYVTLQLSNMRQFIQSSTNEWMLALDRETFSDRLTLYLLDYSFEYFYPNEDFCLFKHLPVEELSKFATYFFIDMEVSNKTMFLKQLDASCTVQYIYSASRFDHSQDTTRKYALYDIYNDTLATKCNFTKRLEQCNLTVYKEPDENFYLNMYDVTNLLEWVDFIGPIIIFPIVCVLGFVTNLLVIVVITRRRFKEDFQQRLFKYILLNSVFNCIECALNLLQLTSECIAPNSVFCSLIRLSRFNQVLRIYIVGYLGEIMKTCSILTCLFFSLERLLDSMESKNKLMVAFRGIKLKVIVSIIVAFAAISSLIKILDFDLTNYMELLSNKGYESPSRFLINEYTVRMALGDWSDQYVLGGLNFAHYLLNDVLFLFLNCFVDFCLLVSIKKGLLLKLKLKNKTLNAKNENSEKIMSQEFSKKIKTEKKTYYMLIFNLTTYIICRLPELTFTFFSFYYSTNMIEIISGRYYFTITECMTLSFCYLLANFVDFLYMISYTTNIYCYYKFNKTFKKNMLLFLHIKHEIIHSNKKL